jgi:hypothetical protein
VNEDAAVATNAPTIAAVLIVEGKTIKAYDTQHNHQQEFLRSSQQAAKTVSLGFTVRYRRFIR